MENRGKEREAFQTVDLKLKKIKENFTKKSVNHRFVVLSKHWLSLTHLFNDMNGMQSIFSSVCLIHLMICSWSVLLMFQIFS